MADVSIFDPTTASLLTLPLNRLESYYCFKSPRLTDIPAYSLPDVEGMPTWYGDMSLRYPSDQQSYSIAFGHGMKALSELRVIQNEISVMCFNRNRSVTPQKMPWGAALHIQTKLEAWYDALPTQLQPQSVVYPPFLILQ
jgi:hypothetical protein